MRIGIDLGGTKIEVVALDSRGAERVRRRVATPAGDYAATLGAIEELVRSTEFELGVVCSVGVGTPGSASPATGRLRNANSTVLNGRLFERDLAVRLGRPVRIANDANCLALSEAADGSAASAATVFGVILGTGVGGGVVVRSGLVAGANAVAGEWGHMPLPWPAAGETPGPACYCGRTGCLETWLSGPALARDHARAGGAGDARGIAAAALAGDPLAAASVERWRGRLARGLALVVDVLDPHAFVFGGGVSSVALADGTLPVRVASHAFSDTLDTRFVPAFRDSSGVRGAARLWPP